MPRFGGRVLPEHAFGTDLIREKKRGPVLQRYAHFAEKFYQFGTGVVQEFDVSIYII